MAGYTCMPGFNLAGGGDVFSSNCAPNSATPPLSFGPVGGQHGVFNAIYKGYYGGAQGDAGVLSVYVGPHQGNGVDQSGLIGATLYGQYAVPVISAGTDVTLFSVPDYAAIVPAGRFLNFTWTSGQVIPPATDPNPVVAQNTGDISDGVDTLNGIVQDIDDLMTSTGGLSIADLVSELQSRFETTPGPGIDAQSVADVLKAALFTTDGKSLADVVAGIEQWLHWTSVVKARQVGVGEALVTLIDRDA